MFSLFKKKKTRASIQAPISGKCIDISEVSDSVFADKLMGDGVAIIPSTNIVHAPCDGILTMLFPSKHAFGMKTIEGDEILIHIGIDTVNLNGVGFRSYKNINEKIKADDMIISFDETYLKKDTIDMTTMVIIVNGGIYMKQNIGQEVNCGEEVLVKKE